MSKIVPFSFRDKNEFKTYPPENSLTAYDNFIGESITEFLETFICCLAKDFFEADYQKGLHDERMQQKNVNNATCIHNNIHPVR